MKRSVLILLTLATCSTIAMQAQVTELWGMTRTGGTDGYGVIFKTDATGNNYTMVHSFDQSSLVDGRTAFGSLLLASNGKLYGMTEKGGSGSGNLFDYDPATNTMTQHVDFDGVNNGKTPYGNLIQASNGMLYGMTARGGAMDQGVMFEFDPALNTYTKLFDFDGPGKGAIPRGSLLEASNGKLYGLTSDGGANGFGTMFEYEIQSSVFTKRGDFEYTIGQGPHGSLVQANNGNLYALVSNGGGVGVGTLVQYTISDSMLTKVADFTANIGKEPLGSLVKSNSGMMYGMTRVGGSFGSELGVLFQFNPDSNRVTKLLDFDGDNRGKYPLGDLIQASNGKLYGMTSEGGANNYGTLFEYDIALDSLTKKHDFADTTGTAPNYTHLIEITYTPVAAEKTATHETLNVLPNPSSGVFRVEGQGLKSISVLSMQGQLVHELEVRNGNASSSVDLTGQADGLYFLHVHTRSRSFIRKIVLK